MSGTFGFGVSDFSIMWQTVGQDRALSLFQNSLKRGSMAHAYLLVGPAHVGKMTLARDLACALNCESAEAPCGECPSCLRIMSGKHADIQEIAVGKLGADGKPMTEIGIEEIRQLQHSASLPPFEGKFRVYIIDGADTLSIEAANCLLKTLEEPAANVVFFLLTTREDLLPETVLSRCQRVELVPLPSPRIESALVERWCVPPERATLLARLSHGSLGWALGATDQGTLDQRNELVEQLIETADADLETRFAYASQLATEFGQSREKVQEKLSVWLDWWHDLLLVKTGLENLVTNVDKTDTLSRMAAELSLEQIRSSIEAVTGASEQLKLNANPRLALEVLMLSMPEAHA